MTPRRFSDSSPEGMQQQLRAHPYPAADEAFRRELRAAFVNGTIAERPTAMRDRSARRLWLRWASASVAAVAACIALMTINAGPAWRSLGMTGATTLRVDGREVALGSDPGWGRLLRAGARLEIPAGGQLDLELPGLAIFQAVGGSEVVLPSSPGRWFNRTITGTLASGELRVTTGARFPGTRLTIRTAEARAIVTGTTLAVLRSRDSTCVCVLEGAVTMRGPSGASEVVHAGFRRSVFAGGRAPVVEAIRPMEIMKLQMLRDQLGAPPAR
ncbi:MAG: hypothetical protein HOP12_13190 [Candidatus Eisenbacteria bacterium]|uniref:FecR protein domain-containing protein n=1 Tax=Eiseniibacteriota bacterium TaxID=2212470 RepID=A0A849SKH8_UNCEI|nr:hypothetical protein [Candidatus Eisenbacteria bacterium]